MPPTIILLESQGPFNLMSANQFKRKTRMKLRIFIVKVAEALIEPFCERNAITILSGTDLTYGSVPGASHLDKIFWSSPVFGKKILQKYQSAEGSTQCKPGSGNNMVCGRNYLLHIFQ